MQGMAAPGGTAGPWRAPAWGQPSGPRGLLSRVLLPAISAWLGHLLSTHLGHDFAGSPLLTQLPSSMILLETI